MSKHRGTIPEKAYSPKQIMFEIQLIDENGYLDPREIFPIGGGEHG